MDMKGHILAALEEQLARWDALLASLSDEQIATPRFDDHWAIKDVVAHLWAWQQLSVARMEAAARDQEPASPVWVAGLPGDWENDANRTNARIYATYHDIPWSELHRQWRTGFLRFLQLGEAIAEKDLLDGGRYPWLKGYPLASTLLASYDHHQEHLEKLLGLGLGSARPGTE